MRWGPPIERFWPKVEKTDTCWLWHGETNFDGYGRMKINGKRVGVHRLAYEWLVGPIPKGLTIDHVKERGCTHRNCVNPAHLEPVTAGENTRRARLAAPRKTHCRAGHEYTEENTYRWGTARYCIACRVAYKRVRKAAA